MGEAQTQSIPDKAGWWWHRPSSRMAWRPVKVYLSRQTSRLIVGLFDARGRYYGDCPAVEMEGEWGSLIKEPKN